MSDDLDKEIMWAESTTGEDFQCVHVDFAREQRAEIERLQRWQRGARAWLASCLGCVTGEGPPNWDGIRAFLANDEQATDGKPTVNP